MKVTPVEQRIWWHIAVRGPDECWPWTRALYHSGHARIDGRHVSRVILGLTDPLVQARHKCDNPPCCNPAHLEPGSAQDNADDQTKRGRRPLGEDRPDSKLTTSEINWIRSDARPYELIATEYGVSRSLVGHIKEGTKWAHVPVTGPVVVRPSNKAPELTARQVEILRHLKSGLRVREIARRLNIRSPGVSQQLASIRRKLAATTNEHAVAIAYHTGIFRTSKEGEK